MLFVFWLRYVCLHSEFVYLEQEGYNILCILEILLEQEKRRVTPALFLFVRTWHILL